ncbi:hypothetical protein H8356DRAFT_1428967 [Neocallimastix lanati (nom. inval.)]|jgi:hypothetical protein|uniref:Cilia-and flagella-associated protein 96 n=1 Tax=Neocallimastix californiae TaxID=1754190 RepID=A0A1Y1ZMQ6_9FUNG|nr:hypothetical protein H8356DRAFT_1428967 [Neocallimastix sp. JGI-2020a]ORY11474.1 hypothetical protein LY90DRAFT_677875 [Neocallimastix californiae]|eukprot:ORY11474.1 hypothetical protein LY90DRAFT_677875 [Neocallimastix californiae]
MKETKDFTIKPDLDRMGLFKEMEYLSNDPYIDQYKIRKSLQRGQGKQFVNNPSKKGHDTNDVYFDGFKRIFEKEAYSKIYEIYRKNRLDKLKKVTVPFRPSNICPQGSGKGSIYGTFDHQYPLNDKEKDNAVKPKSATPPTKSTAKINKNIYTNPAKKGVGYGYVDITIGKYYEYMSDPYDRMKEINKKERLEKIKKNIDPKPFIAGSKNNDYFDNSGFSWDINQETIKKNKKAEKLPEIKKLEHPFRPASNIDYTINKFPEYISDGIETKKNEELLKRAQLRKEGKLNSFTNGNLKLGGTIKTYPISSIIDKSISQIPPRWAQESLQNGRKVKEIKKVINYNDPIVLFPYETYK